MTDRQGYVNTTKVLFRPILIDYQEENLIRPPSSISDLLPTSAPPLSRNFNRRLKTPEINRNLVSGEEREIFIQCCQVRTMGRFKMAATMFNDVIYRHGP